MTAPMTAPMTAVSPPPDPIALCDHPWPVARPCEPGVLAACAGCGLTFAPCTATLLDVLRVKARTWRCPSCDGGA